MVVWKFDIRQLNDAVAMMVPKGATILTAQNQRGVLCVWALCDPEAPMVPHHIRIVGTGHRIDPANARKFIGTVQMLDGDLVWHLFDLGE